MKLINYICSLLLLLMNPLQAGVEGNTADYIIVGIGSSGGLLAKKLSDDKKTSVIALHSGDNFTNSFILKYGKNTLFSVLAATIGPELPFDISSLNLPPNVTAELTKIYDLSNDRLNSLYENGLSIPQVNADNRQILWAIPLPLGGGTGVNAGAYCRGTNQFFSQWEAIDGPEWSVNKILAIYKELERFHGKTTNPLIRGYNGPLRVRQDPPSKLAEIFTQAEIKATGTPFVLDYNDPNTPIGVSSQFQLTRHGLKSFYRVSSATAFLNHHVMTSDGSGVKGRKLQVYFNSIGLRTIWEGNKAVGVEYSQNGEIKQVYANKGIIVCSGLRSSPFLLHSGVGPASLLNSLSIPVVYDNPNVGQNLCDQQNTLMLYASNPEDSNSKSNGVFSQIAWLPAPGGDPISRQVRISTVDVIPGLTVSILDLCQPKSRGSVSINSNNPLDPPVIDLGIFSNPDDLSLFVSAYMTYVKNINIALQAIDPAYYLVFPDPAILDNASLVEEYVKAIVASNLHFQGHCKMAPLDQDGVVDFRGKVYGVENLYVADNSVVPSVLDGSPMASAYLVAENIARLLGY